MRSTMRLNYQWMRPAAAAALALTLNHPAVAIAQERPLKESEVTERGLIEALAPRPEDAASAGAAGATDLSRGFKVTVLHAPRRQSILMTFDTDSSELLPRTKAMLDVVAKALQSDRMAAVPMVIEGHADARGNEGHNLVLSEARARSVVAYLVREHDIPPERLRAVGKGSTELLNRAVPTAPENRRVSLIAQP